MSGLSSNAMLFSLNVRLWTARKKARRVAKDIAAQAGAVDGAVRATKSLLPHAKAHDRVLKSAGQLRAYVYDKTLPWTDGVRILKSSNYMNFMAGLRRLTTAHEQNVDDFIQEYDLLVRDAKTDLASLFVATDYPSTDDLRKKFAIETRFLPVPDVEDWRVDLNAEAVADLRADVEKSLKTSQEIAMKDVFDRIFEVVSNAYERLKDPDAIFKDSLVDNAVKLCKILPSLNIANDPRVDELSRRIMNTLGKQAPYILRKDQDARKKTAAAMQSVMNKMGALYKNGGGVS